MSRHPVRAYLSDSNPPQSNATCSGEAHLRTHARVSSSMQPRTSCVTSEAEAEGRSCGHRGTQLRIAVSCAVTDIEGRTCGYPLATHTLRAPLCGRRIKAHNQGASSKTGRGHSSCSGKTGSGTCHSSCTSKTGTGTGHPSWDDGMNRMCTQTTMNNSHVGGRAGITM